MIREENIYEIIKQDKENAIENLVKQTSDLIEYQSSVDIITNKTV